MFTDGVTEAMNDDNEIYGTERLQESLSRAPAADQGRDMASLPAPPFHAATIRNARSSQRRP